MNEFHCIVNTVPVEDAPTRLLRHAGTAPTSSLAMEALARLLTIESARRRAAEAKYEEALLRIRAGEGADA